MSEETPSVRVIDRPTENGVRINNVLTGLLLAAALWVGSSVEDLKGAVVLLASEQQHAGEDIRDIERNVGLNSARIITLERLHPEYYEGKQEIPRNGQSYP